MGVAPRCYLLQGMWEGAGLRGADQVSQPFATSQRAAQRLRAGTINRAPSTPQRDPLCSQASSLSGFTEGQSLPQAAVLIAPTSSRDLERSTLCSISAGQRSQYKEPKLEHTIASNLKLQRDEENAPCRTWAALPCHLWSEDFYVRHKG